MKHYHETLRRRIEHSPFLLPSCHAISQSVVLVLTENASSQPRACLLNVGPTSWHVRSVPVLPGADSVRPSHAICLRAGCESFGTEAHRHCSPSPYGQKVGVNMWASCKPRHADQENATVATTAMSKRCISRTCPIGPSHVTMKLNGRRDTCVCHL